MTGSRAAGAAAQPLRFSREHRLRSAADFKRVYAQGRRLGNEFFTVNAQANGLPTPRLGLSVAVRVMGNAVRRNRIRRVIRESFRLNQSIVPPMDIIVGVRSAARDATPAVLRESLEQIWRRLRGSGAGA